MGHRKGQLQRLVMKVLITLLSFACLLTRASVLQGERTVEIVINYQRPVGQNQKHVIKTKAAADGKVNLKNYLHGVPAPICDPVSGMIVTDFIKVGGNVNKVELYTRTVKVVDLSDGTADVVRVCKNSNFTTIMNRFRSSKTYTLVENETVNSLEVFKVAPKDHEVVEITILDPIAFAQKTIKIAVMKNANAKSVKLALSRLSGVHKDLIALCGNDNEEIKKFTDSTTINLPKYVKVQYDNVAKAVPTCESTAKICKDTSFEYCDTSIIKRLLILFPQLAGKEFKLKGLTKGAINEFVGNDDYEEELVTVELKGQPVLAENEGVEDEGKSEDDKKYKLKRNKKITTRSIIGMSIIVSLHVLIVIAIVWCLCFQVDPDDE